ncbi:MAG: tRNA lysidine(34) synthetase TilS [Odoribacter sp.]|nr:tRNA lysidine(34) synthetase TilS [Odoribacter sp.]
MLQPLIRQFLNTHHIPQNARFLIAVSGGADSISLLHAFSQLKLNITVLHCNFALRGEESDQDEQFVKDFCHTHDIKYRIKKFDTAGYARRQGISIEMAARELRYAWFREIKEKEKMDYIVVAHHADDMTETMLINLCRGTGIRGLCGIKPVNGDILRPLLSCSRNDILQYIGQHRLDYRNDSSNDSTNYVRNKIRHQVIPVLKEINPAFLNTMAENGEILKETETIFLYGIRRLQTEILHSEEGETFINIEKTLASPAPYTLLYETLRPFGFNKEQIRAILDSHTATPGKQFRADKHLLVKDRNHWRLYDDSQCHRIVLTIPTPGVYTTGSINISLKLFARPENFVIPQQTGTACLDADKIRFPLIVRNWQAGDSFCPLGMNKSRKKLSDFFTDQKFSTRQKQECLLLLSDGQITWLIGYRTDERFKITPSTRNILLVELLPKTD